MSLTDAGLTVDRLEDIRTRMRENLVAAFGPNTNTDSDSVFGQLIDVFAAELVSVNELALQVYDSFDPDQAEGTQLDNLASLLGLSRQAAEFSNGVAVLTGDDGTVVSTGSIIEASGSGNRFVTLADVTITDTTLSTGNLTFADANPDTITRTTGSWIADGVAPGTVVVIAGSASNDGTYTVDLVTALTLTLSAAASLTNEGPVGATATIGRATVGVESSEEGPFTALSTAIDTIVTSVTGWETVTNPEDIDPGRYAETDLELRLRMEASKQATGAGVDGAIEAQVLELGEVEYAKVWSNRSDSQDSQGRPPHSFELVVHPDTGDQDYRDEIAALLFNLQPAGIESYGSSSFNVTDEQGFTQVVKYSFATLRDIYFDVTITKTASYPADGDAQVAAAILAEGTSQGVGDDVLNWKYVAGCDAIPGIADIVVKQGFSVSPSSSANLSIGETEIADVDSSRITVTSA